MRYVELLEAESPHLFLAWPEKVKVGTTLAWFRGADPKRDQFVESILEQNRPASVLSRAGNLIVFESPKRDGRYWYSVSAPTKSLRLHSGWLLLMRSEHEAQSRDWAERYWAGDACSEGQGEWHYIVPVVRVRSLAHDPVSVEWVF